MIKILKQFPLFIAKKNLQKAYNPYGKDTPKIQIGITSFAYIDTTFSCKVGFSGSAISNMLSEISGIQGSCHGNKIWAKINKNCTVFNSAQKIENFFTLIVRFSGSAKLNMLSKILREPRELPWQPNLCKNKKNCTDFNCYQKF